MSTPATPAPTEPEGRGAQEKPGGSPPLKRALGTKLLILFVIGDILGTGIYATTGNVAGKVGGALWLPFAIGFAVALLTAATNVEHLG
ncbi:amino acid permease, partial [Streptomyces anulatus]